MTPWLDSLDFLAESPALDALPFALNVFRVACILAMLAIPRNHRHREILLGLLILLALASDLLDGSIARALGLTHLVSLYWTDHGADLLAVVGAAWIAGRRVSWAQDLAPRPRVEGDPPPERRRRRRQISGHELPDPLALRRERRQRGLWMLLGFLLTLEIQYLVVMRVFREL